MKVSFDSETLKTTLRPESSDERRFLLAMLQLFRSGGTLKAKSRRMSLSCKFRPKKG